MEDRNRSWKRWKPQRGDSSVQPHGDSVLSLVLEARLIPNPNRERQNSLATIEELDGDKRLVKNAKTPKDDAVMRGEGVIIELWILLQAIVVIVVFVYSMARGGPRAILDAAEVRHPC